MHCLKAAWVQTSIVIWAFPRFVSALFVAYCLADTGSTWLGVLQSLGRRPGCGCGGCQAPGSRPLHADGSLLMRKTLQHLHKFSIYLLISQGIPFESLAKQL